MDINRQSRVFDEQTLKSQTEQTLRGFGKALIEKFIVGNEFTVLGAENPSDANAPVTFEPIEFCFLPEKASSTMLQSGKVMLAYQTQK